MSLPVGTASPWGIPLALIGCAAIASLLALGRLRRSRRGGSRGLSVVYAAIGLVALAVAGVEIAARLQLFWHVEWDAASQTLVLDRPAPVRDVLLTNDTIGAITEVAARERSLSGLREVVRFVVHTESGEEYWSAPVHDSESAGAVRRLLESAGKGRLESFSVGGASLR